MERILANNFYLAQLYDILLRFISIFGSIFSLFNYSYNLVTYNIFFCFKIWHWFTIIIIIFIIKTSSTGQSGKNKIVYKLLSQPNKNLRHGKLRNKLTKATNDWLLP